MERKRCADFSWGKTCATTPFSSTGVLLNFSLNILSSSKHKGRVLGKIIFEKH